MVNVNGDPTRTRARIDTRKTVVIDRSHRLIGVHDAHMKDYRDRFVAAFSKAYAALSPASRRVLQAARRAAFISYDSKLGYRFATSINRAAIARELGRSALVPYDIRLLRALAGKQLLIEGKRALPRQQHGDIWLGSGAEYVYTVPTDVLFGLLAIDEGEKDRLAELTAQSAARAARQAEQATKQKERAELERARYRLPVKESLWDRFLDWLGL